jgi:predicted permease
MSPARGQPDPRLAPVPEPVFMRTVSSDLVYALRRLVRSPGFTAVALVSLGLGIGANCAIFTFVNSILLRPLPAVERPDEVVRLFSTDDEQSSFHQISYLNFRDLRRLTRSLDGLAGFVGIQASLGRDQQSRLERVQMVTGEYFRVLGVRAARGRTFSPDEGALSRTDPIVVLSHGLWQRQFAADPDVIGQTLTVNGNDLTIIGVAPEGFHGVSARVPAQAWVPLNLRRRLIRGPLNELFEDRGSGIVETFGRLGGGVGVQQARAALQGLGAELERRYPVANKDKTFAVVPAREATIEPDLRHKYAVGGGLLMGVVGLVLLIACVNLAGLLLTRSLARSNEIAVRLSIGARRRHVIRMLLAESVVLGVFGGVLGLLLALWSRDALWALRPPELSEAFAVSMDVRVLGFTFALSLLTVLIFGLVPAVRLSRPELVAALKGGEPFGAWPGIASRARRILVSFQVALSLVLVLGAILFLRSLERAEKLDPGFAVDNHLVFAFDLGSLDYSPQQGQQFYDRTVERLRNLPGARSAAIGESLELYPSALGYWLRPVIVQGRQVPSDAEADLVQSNTVGTGYFETLDLSLLEGRTFEERDRAGQPRVVIVNQTMAERFWPERSAVGEHIVFQGEDEPLRVVGVVADAKYNTLGEKPKPYLYLPLRQEYTSPVFVHLRTEGDAEAMLPAVRTVMRELDEDLGLGFTLTMRQVFEQSLWAPRLGATLFLIFGLLALGLAGLGIYGIISYSVSQRRKELSVRLALGAERGALFALMLKQGLLLAVLGIAVGLGFALAAERLARSFLFGLEGTDLTTVASAIGILLLMAVLANLLAAGKTLSVQPQEVLRER